ncbi:hypothetical protein [Aliarcobacter butzleri]|uniref:hypothetical protein n=1 Tax=Aliarcobacter butzleri TaxID=28197 RepID=UPI0015878D64|nr:hypothetical protein [Aliarcobacter butzleri]NUW25334.1 hypothetical protein [Aliarcobacter butzleri]
MKYFYMSEEKLRSEWEKFYKKISKEQKKKNKKYVVVDFDQFQIDHEKREFFK